MKIQQRMIYTFLIITFVFVISIGISLYGTNRIKEGIVQKLPSVRSKQAMVTDVQFRLKQIRIMQSEMLRNRDAGQYDHIDEAVEAIQKNINEIGSGQIDDREKQLLSQLGQTLETYRTSVNEKIIPEIEANWEEEINKRYVQSIQSSRDLLALGQQLIKQYITEINNINGMIQKANNRIGTTTAENKQAIEKLEMLTAQQYERLLQIETLVREQDTYLHPFAENPNQRQRIPDTGKVRKQLEQMASVNGDIKDIAMGLSEHLDPADVDLSPHIRRMHQLLSKVQKCSMLMTNTYHQALEIYAYTLLKQPDHLQKYGDLYDANVKLLEELTDREGLTEQIKDASNQFNRDVAQIESGIKHFDEKKIQAGHLETQKILDHAEDDARDLQDAFSGYLADTLQESQHIEKNLRGIVITVTIVAVILGSLATLLLSKSIVKPIRLILKALSDIEEGKIFIQNDVRRKDEIGELAKKLKQLLTVQLAMQHEIAASSDNISTTKEVLSHFFDKMKKRVEQTVNDLAEVFSRPVSQYADHAMDETKAKHFQNKMEEHLHVLQEVREVGQKARKSVQNSHGLLQDVQNSMTEVNASMNKTVSSMEELEDAALQIQEMTEAIKGIASRTNLLALNAAIEASRAGESGKGFAVVADEINKLADNSNKAAQGIERVVQKLHVKVRNAVSLIDTGVEAFEKGDHRIEKTGNSMESTKNDINELVVSLDTTAAFIIEIKAFILELINSLKHILHSIENTRGSQDEINDKVQQVNSDFDEIQKIVYRLNEVSASLEKYKN